MSDCAVVLSVDRTPTGEWPIVMTLRHRNGVHGGGAGWVKILVKGKQ